MSRYATLTLGWHTLNGTMTVSELAEALGCCLYGPGEREITGVCGLEQAGPEHLTFLSNAKYLPKVSETRAGAILLTQKMDGIAPACLVSSNPYLDFARALNIFYQVPRATPGIHPTAVVAESVRIGEGASIGAYCVVGERVTIGRNAVLHPHVVVYEGVEIGDDFLAHSHVAVREFCRIGDRVTLQNGVVIGGDGFGFAKQADGSHFKIVQSGVAVIEDDVEVQTLTSVDRASIGETRVKRGAKIDSLVQVGHACVIGEDNIVCAQTGLAGSSVLEKNVLLAGQVGVSGHLTIQEGAVVYAQSGVGGNVDARATVSGSPAFDSFNWLRSITAFQKLPDLVRSVRDLKKRLERLERK